MIVLITVFVSVRRAVLPFVLLKIKSVVMTGVVVIAAIVRKRHRYAVRAESVLCVRKQRIVRLERSVRRISVWIHAIPFVLLKTRTAAKTVAVAAVERAKVVRSVMRPVSALPPLKVKIAPILM